MREISAGGVVYRRQQGQLFVQMIEDRYGKMTLAKGKQEPGETLEQTALREIREETGVEGKLVGRLATVAYRYNHPVSGEWVDKEVHYYLVEALSDNITAQVEEINAVHWLSPEEAWKSQLNNGYENNQSVLKQALVQLGVEV